MQTIDAGTIAEDDAEYSENLDDEAIAGCEVCNVINGTHIEHHAHSEDDGQDGVAVAETCSKQGATYDAKEHGNASHDRHGSLL